MQQLNAMLMPQFFYSSSKMLVNYQKIVIHNGSGELATETLLYITAFAASSRSCDRPYINVLVLNNNNLI